MRVFGLILFLLGIVLLFGILTAPLGIIFIIAGIVMMALGGRRKTVIHNVIQVSNNVGQQEANFDDDDRGRRRGPVARQAEPPMLPKRARQPMLESADNIDDQPFVDLRNEISTASKRVLAFARQDGFDLAFKSDRVVATREEVELIFQSNHAIERFGLRQGYDRTG
jgi:hypothetical protein